MHAPGTWQHAVLMRESDSVRHPRYPLTLQAHLGTLLMGLDTVALQGGML